MILSFLGLIVHSTFSTQPQFYSDACDMWVHVNWMFPFPTAHSLKCSSGIGSMAGDEPGAMQEDGEINFYFVGENT